jgi:excinuclease ABC subunit B
LAGAKERAVAAVPRIADIPKEEIPHLIADLENQMELAAKNLEFEKAALLRDELTAIKNQNKSSRAHGSRGSRSERYK